MARWQEGERSVRGQDDKKVRVMTSLLEMIGNVEEDTTLKKYTISPSQHWRLIKSNQIDK